MKIDYQHNLRLEDTYAKINTFLTDLQEQYSDKISNVKTSWNLNRTHMTGSMELMGCKTRGTIVLTDGQVTLEGTVPFYLSFFRNKIKKIVTTKLEDLLS